MKVLTNRDGNQILAEERNGYYLVEHAALKKLINKNKISFSYRIVSAEVEHVIYHCIMKDPGSGRTVEGIGETMIDTLTTNREKRNIIKIAANRAFDDAALTLLDFEEQIYSNEGLTRKPKQSEAETVKAENEIKEESEQKKMPEMPEGLPDILLVGPLRGKKYSEMKDTTEMHSFIKYIKENPQLLYGGDIKRQVDFLKTLE